MRLHPSGFSDCRTDRTSVPLCKRKFASPRALRSVTVTGTFLRSHRPRFLRLASRLPILSERVPTPSSSAQFFNCCRGKSPPVYPPGQGIQLSMNTRGKVPSLCYSTLFLKFTDIFCRFLQIVYKQRFVKVTSLLYLEQKNNLSNHFGSNLQIIHAPSLLLPLVIVKCHNRVSNPF